MTHKIPVLTHALNWFFGAERTTKTDLQNCLLMTFYGRFSAALMTALEWLRVGGHVHFFSRFLTLTTVIKNANQMPPFSIPNGTSVVNNITNPKSTIL